jgi:hypothetical protein
MQVHLRTHQDLSLALSGSLHAHIMSSHSAPKILWTELKLWSEERFEAIFGTDNRVATESDARRMQKLLVAEVGDPKYKGSWGRSRGGDGRPKQAGDAEDTPSAHAPEAKFLGSMAQSYAVWPAEFLPGLVAATFADRDAVAPGVALLRPHAASDSFFLFPHTDLVKGSLDTELDTAAARSLARVLIQVAEEGRKVAAEWEKDVYGWVALPKGHKDKATRTRPCAPDVTFDNPVHVYALQCMQAKHGKEVLNFYPAAAMQDRGLPPIRLDDMAVVLTYLSNLDCDSHHWLTATSQLRPKLATLKALLHEHFGKQPSTKKVSDSRKLVVWFTEVAPHCLKEGTVKPNACGGSGEDSDDEDQEDKEENLGAGEADGLPSDSSGSDEEDEEQEG